MDTISANHELHYFIPDEQGESTYSVKLQDEIDRVLTAITKSGCVYREIPVFLSKDKNAIKSIAIIPSTSEHALRALLRQILDLAYGEKDGWYPYDRYKMVYHKKTYFVFLYVPGTSEELLAILQPLEAICTELFIGNVERSFRLSELITNIQVPPSEKKELSPHELRLCIERSVFSGGATEIRELLNRESNAFHTVLNTIMSITGLESRYRPAIRLLLGAVTAGEVTVEEAANALNQDKRVEIKEAINVLVSAPPLIEDRAVASLQDYVKGKRCLLIEDKYKEDGWVYVLPLLLKGLDFNVKSNPTGVPEEENLQKYDFIILDLYSSPANPFGDKTEGESGHHQIQTISSIPLSVRQILNKIRDLYKKDGLVKTYIPNVIIFSADRSGVCVRTMLTDLGCIDYFFKEPFDGVHKGQFYSTFKNCIVNAMMASTARVCGYVNREYGWTVFDEWIRQFTPSDRPTVLRFMKHFRYYSAFDIINLLDIFFKEKTRYDSSGKKVISGLLPIHLPADETLLISYLGRLNKSGPATVSIFSKAKWFRDDLLGAEKPVMVTYDDLPKKISERLDKRGFANVIILDDVVMSGGQIQNYLWKFIQRHFSAKINNREKPINLCVISVIGVDVDKIMGIDRNGDVVVKICKDSHHKLYDSCNCKETITIPIHFIDKHKGVIKICEEITANQGLDYWSKVERVLQTYTGISEPRKKERQCDFEPLGWKDCGALVATYSNVPGNSLPIIWGDRRDNNDNPLWTPLHRRYFN